MACRIAGGSTMCWSLFPASGAARNSMSIGAGGIGWRRTGQAPSRKLSHPVCGRGNSVRCNAGLAVRHGQAAAAARVPKRQLHRNHPGNRAFKIAEESTKDAGRIMLADHHSLRISLKIFDRLLSAPSSHRTFRPRRRESEYIAPEDDGVTT